MGLFTKLLLGTGRFRPQVRETLDSEGLVALEEGLPGSLGYRNFRAPGKRFHRKVTAERLALGISEVRLAVYCRSGRVKLIDTPFSEPRLSALEVSLVDPETLALQIDYDRANVPRVSGQITIKATTPKAPQLIGELQERLNRRA